MVSVKSRDVSAVLHVLECARLLNRLESDCTGICVYSLDFNCTDSDFPPTSCNLSLILFLLLLMLLLFCCCAAAAVVVVVFCIVDVAVL